jgi:agmatinase
MPDKNNFGDLPKENSNKENSKIVIIPVPYDETSTWIKGADKGPEAIIEASGNMELYDIETNSQVYLRGIYTSPPIIENSSPEKMVTAVQKTITTLIKENKFIVVLGGEHSVTIGAVKAHAEHYKNLSVLQLDAHSDLRDEYDDSKYNHACVMARAKELCPIVQVGIRSMDVCEKENMDTSRVFFAKDIYKNTNWIEQVNKKLTENVYITIDLDVFDPSIMPSTGTPEPGGMLWYNVLELLKTISKEKNIVGVDVVELCPNEQNKAPDFMAAKLIYKLLSYKFEDEAK